MHIRKLTRQPPKKGKQANQILNTANEHKKKHKSKEKKSTHTRYIHKINFAFKFQLFSFTFRAVTGWCIWRV